MELNELILLEQEEGINILFNPESRASCTIPSTALKQLLTLPNVPGNVGERKLLISRHDLDQTGPFSALWQALKVGQHVQPLPDEKFTVEPDAIRQIPKNIAIYPILSCNLHCKYCWNAHGTYGRMDNSVMSQEIAAQTGRWISSLIASSRDPDGGVQNIDIFGGEPLLASDAFRLITESVHKAARKQSRNISILLQTNGLLLTLDLIRFCKDHQVKIAISLDGPADIHDAMRITPKNEGSHRRVVEAIQNVMSIYPPGLQIRVTLMPPYDVFRVYDYLNSLGIPDNVVAISRVTPLQFTEGQVKFHNTTSWQFNRALWHRFLVEYLRRLQAGEWRCFIRSVFETLSHAIQPKGSPRITPCRLGVGAPAVLPDGRIVPCYMFAFDSSMTFGNVADGINPDKVMTIMEKVRALSVWAFEPCRTCFVRYLCGGPCYAWNKALTGSLNNLSEVACDVNRESCISELFAAALWIQKDPTFIGKMRANQTKEKDKLLLEAIFKEHYLKDTAN